MIAAESIPKTYLRHIFLQKSYKKQCPVCIKVAITTIKLLLIKHFVIILVELPGFARDNDYKRTE